ncbi:MAG: dTDP-4-dehydrorhamnose 3,5-epimerase family protein [Pseudomonadales bacterium]|nr:dTDP-4-dehydrorhamnose 3,5-epimerase family protein [Pseudomonadales bacterium]
MIETTFIPTTENKIGDCLHKTSIEGLYYIPHNSFPDKRGFYSELSIIPEIEKVTNEKFVIKQMNQSRSYTNVARGIHTENWNKLINVTSGLCFCALIDLRPDSPTFSKYESFYLGIDQKALQGSLYVSKGIGNSMCILKGPVDYIYAVDAVWKDRDPNGDTAIALFDPDINIQWPISKDQMIVSKRDVESIPLRNMFPDKF